LVSRRAIDLGRPSASARGYDRTWQKIRAAQLARQPWCADCEDFAEEFSQKDFPVTWRGLQPANEVHHIDHNSRNNAPENLMGLCHDCHSARTMRESVVGVGK